MENLKQLIHTLIDTIIKYLETINEILNILKDTKT